MIHKDLYIIGNGFDQHHNIKCTFLKFMEWIKENDAGLFFKLTKVYNSAWEYNWWRDFENSLALLNINYNATDKEGSQGYYRKRYVCCNGIYNSS